MNAEQCRSTAKQHHARLAELHSQVSAELSALIQVYDSHGIAELGAMYAKTKATAMRLSEMHRAQAESLDDSHATA